MSKFFSSEIVRKELEEIHSLQSRLQKIFLTSATFSQDEKIEFISLLRILVEKQEIMYFRMKLSDDEESQNLIEQIRQSAIALGISPKMTLDTMFKQMKESIDLMEKRLDVSNDP